MPLFSFFVVRHENVWRVKHDGKDSRAFLSEGDAIKEAVGLARMSAGTSGRVQVLVQNADLTFRREWSYRDQRKSR